MIRPISSVLVDFHRPKARPVMPSFQMEVECEAEAPPSVDIDELTREAEERGHERGRAEAAAEYEEERAASAAAQEQQLEEHLQAARQEWVDGEGIVLADRLDHAMSELRETIALHTANILQALVEPAVKERMLGEVVQAIETLTRQDATMLLRVEGPADLLESIRKSLAGRVRSLDLVEAETPDVRVIAQDSVIETQLGAWLEGLKEGGDA